MLGDAPYADIATNDVADSVVSVTINSAPDACDVFTLTGQKVSTTLSYLFYSFHTHCFLYVYTKPLTNHERAATLSCTLGRNIVYADVSSEQRKELLEAAGKSPDEIDVCLSHQIYFEGSLMLTHVHFHYSC